MQIPNRRASAARCDSVNPNFSQRVSSSQGASSSGRQWLSASDPAASSHQDPLICKANIKDSDLHLPRVDDSGSDGPGSTGGGGSSGSGGGGGGGGGDDEDDDDKLLSTAEVSSGCERTQILLKCQHVMATVPQ